MERAFDLPPPVLGVSSSLPQEFVSGLLRSLLGLDSRAPGTLVQYHLQRERHWPEGQ